MAGCAAREGAETKTPSIEKKLSSWYSRCTGQTDWQGWPVRVVFVENEDSFSWNVIDLLPCPRQDVLIVPGPEAARRQDLLDRASVLVIGPGPTDPARAGILGLVGEAVGRRLPVLGICLGHQAIGLFYGAQLVRVAPMHGRQSIVHFTRSRLFPGIEGNQTVMRYHSLALCDVVPPLTMVAWCAGDGIVMAIEHESLPLAGLQFHPDSFATPNGARMLEAFFGAAR